MSYLVRLACVCLASFCLLHTALGLLVASLAPLAVRLADRIRPATGASLLFLLRLLPLTASVLAVFAFCIPSYVRFERDASEAVGLPCLLLALLGLATIASGAIRLSTSLCLSVANRDRDARLSVFALVGFLRPRVVVSPTVRKLLSPSQMEVALLHEAAHCGAHDNLKRLAIVASPGLIPFHHSFRSLETQWARLAELAADDAATAAQPLRAIALAEALVRVARLSCRPASFPVSSALVASRDDLAERVERLLAPRPADGFSPSKTGRAAAFSTAATGLALLAVLPRDLLYSVHCAMEHLVH
jgi:hypothetical protein